MRSKETINFACGHTDTVFIEGYKRSDIEWKAEHMAEGLCPECLAEERRKQSERFAKENEAAGFCKLNGSPKQIAWAESIRHKWLDQLREEAARFIRTAEKEMGRSGASITEEQKNTLLNAIDYFGSSQAEKDLKDYSNAGKIIELGFPTRWLYDRARTWDRNNVPIIEPVIYEPEREAKKSGTVTVWAQQHDDTMFVHVQYAKDQDFINLMHKYEFSWSHQDHDWSKNAYTVGSHDAVSLGAYITQALVNNGFRVQIKDRLIQNALESGEYRPYQFLQCSTDDKNHFCLTVTDAVRDEALKLPKARLKKGYDSSYPDVVRVQLTYAAEVAEFVDAYGYDKSKKAAELLDAASKARKGKISPAKDTEVKNGNKESREA